MSASDSALCMCGGEGEGREQTLVARATLLREFQGNLRNMSKLMDCVGCERCRLWGKVQVHGLGVALRLLYEPRREAVLRALRRADVVALLQLLGRLSHSVEVARIVVPLLHHAHCAGCRESTFVAAPDDEPPPAAAPSLRESWELTEGFSA